MRIDQSFIVDLWNHMERHYGSKHTSKDDSSFMSTVGGALDLINVLDKDDFMSTYTTTIGNTIYCPFVVGVPDDVYSLYDQFIICIHEHQHVYQYQKDGLTFFIDYLADSSDRALYEAEALTAGFEMRWWYKQSLPNNIAARANVLKHYGCNEVDIAVAGKALEIASKVVCKGGIVTDASLTAMEYLRQFD